MGQDDMRWQQKQQHWSTHAVYTSEKLIIQSAWLCCFFCQSYYDTCADSLRSSQI